MHIQPIPELIRNMIELCFRFHTPSNDSSITTSFVNGDEVLDEIYKIQGWYNIIHKELITHYNNLINKISILYLNLTDDEFEMACHSIKFLINNSIRLSSESFEWKSSPFKDYIFGLPNQINQRYFSGNLDTSDGNDSKSSNTFQCLDEIFIDKESMKLAYNALQFTTPAVVDKSFNFLLGERKKSAFTAWLKVLKDKGRIKNVNEIILANLLNKKIQGLHISSTSGTLRKIDPPTKTAKKYIDEFKYLIP